MRVIGALSGLELWSSACSPAPLQKPWRAFGLGTARRRGRTISNGRLLLLKAPVMDGRRKNAKSSQPHIMGPPAHGLQVIDDAIHSFGAAGVSADTPPLAEIYAMVRTLRLADGRTKSTTHRARRIMRNTAAGAVEGQGLSPVCDRISPQRRNQRPALIYGVATPEALRGRCSLAVFAMTHRVS